MRKIAFVFPGQGSQTMGMGKSLSENFHIGKELFERANAALGFDLKKLCLEGPDEELKKTAITQPAILTVSAIAFEVLSEKGIRPTELAGHSLGEYSALYAARALSFEDAVKIVHLRGKFMQDATPLGFGGMAAVMGLPIEKLLEACAQTGAEPANINSPGQVVISGTKDAVAKASALCKDMGAKRVIELQVSAPFHSSLMKPAADKLAAELEKIQVHDAQVPVVSNVTADHVKSSAKIKELLIKQVTSPVRWSDSVQKMVADSISHFIEVGPKTVLCGLIKSIDKTVKLSNVEDAASLETTIKEANE